jgi:hypothetical protein
MTWDWRLYFPSEGRRAEDFFALKNPTTSAGFEPANLGTKGQHATSRPPKPETKITNNTQIHITTLSFKFHQCDLQLTVWHRRILVPHTRITTESVLTFTLLDNAFFSHGLCNTRYTGYVRMSHTKAKAFIAPIVPSIQKLPMFL